MFKDAYDAVAFVHVGNYKHVTRGYRLGEMSDLDVLKQAGGELLEVQDACTHHEDHRTAASREAIVSELGDTISCLLHVAVKHGITLEELAEAMVSKLERRFAAV